MNKLKLIVAILAVTVGFSFQPAWSQSTDDTKKGRASSSSKTGSRASTKTSKPSTPSKKVTPSRTVKPSRVVKPAKVVKPVTPPKPTRTVRPTKVSKTAPAPKPAASTRSVKPPTVSKPPKTVPSRGSSLTPPGSDKVPDSMRKARPQFRYEPKPRSKKPSGGIGITPGKSGSAAPGIGASRKNDNGSGGNGGNGGNGNNGNGDDDDNDRDVVIIYCHCCGCPWWDCAWCRFWSPIYWCYCGYDYYYWQHYWNHSWNKRFAHFHSHYDFSGAYPSIYSSQALMIDPQSEAIRYLDEGAALFREGRYLEACEKFRLATLVDLDFAVPKFAFAHGLFALGLYDTAAFEILRGLAIMPEWIEVGGDLKLMYGDPNDFEEQKNGLIAHLKLHRDKENALLVLGFVSYFSGDLYLAEKVFQRLAASSSADTAAASALFLNAVERIKTTMAQMGSKDLLTDDGLTIDQILQQ